MFVSSLKKSAPLSDLASMLKVPLMDYTNPLYHWDFSTKWVEKESEIGLFFDLALCLLYKISGQACFVDERKVVKRIICHDNEQKS